jgi:O-antigen ligase
VLGRSLIVPGALTWPLGLLIVAMVPGLLLAHDVYPVIRLLVLWTAFFLIFEMVAEGDGQAVRNVLIAMAAAGGALAVIALVANGGQTHQLIDFGYETTGRAKASLSQPNLLGIVLAIAIPCQAALVLRGPQRLRGPALAAVVATFPAVLLTLSRGALIGLAGGLGVFLFWAPFRRAAAVFFIVVFGLSFAGVNPIGSTVPIKSVIQRFSVTQHATTLDDRVLIYRAAPRIVRDHPIFGVGAGNFGAIAPEYGLVNRYGQVIDYPHNIALGIAAEMGLLGLAALLWFCFALSRALVRVCTTGPARGRVFGFALAAAFFAVALQGVVDYVLRDNAFVGTLFALAGCVAALDRAGRPRTAS